MKSYVVLLVACATLGAAGAAAVWALRDAPAGPDGPAVAGGPPVAVAPVDIEDTGSPRWPPRTPGEKLVPVPAPRDPDDVPPPVAPPPPGGAPDGAAPHDPSAQETPVPGRGLRFVFGGVPGVAEVDWRLVGARIHAGQKDLRRAARRTADGDDFADLDDQIGGVILRVMELAQPMLDLRPRPGGEGGYEHGAVLSNPAFESNAMAGLLEAANRPLSDAQVEALRPLWERHLETLVRSRGDPDGPWPIAGLIEFSRARAALQPDVEAVLDAGQRGVVWPAETRGRLMIDLFGPGMAWLQRVHRVPILANRPLEELVTHRLFDITRTRDPVGVTRFYPRVRKWLDERPEAWRKGAGGGLGRRGYVLWEEFDPGLDGLPELGAEIAASIPRETWLGGAKPLDGAVLLQRTDR